MEDYILREIRKITMLLEALVKKTDAAPDGGFDVIRQELAKELALDIDEVIISEDPVSILIAKGFSNEEMDALTSLLQSVKGAMSMYRQGQIEVLSDHVRQHFQTEGYLSLALWQ